MANKKAQKLRNPFVYEGYVSSEYFCDRTVETENIISDLENGRNLTLVSPRKIGKTGLIMHAFERIKQKYPDAVCIYIDIFHTQNQYDFVQALGNAIVQERLLNAKNKNKVLSFFKSLRPVISFDSLTGAPTVSVTLERTNTEHTLKGIFDYLRDCGKEVFLAIDEFQAVTNYPEKGTEALLRSYIQFVHNVHFVFSGSKQHLMYEIFGSPERPFYQSTAMMSLEPLYKEIYYDFANHFFKDNHGELSEEVFYNLYDRFSGYTWYVQSVLNKLYEHEKRVVSKQQVSDAILDVLADKRSQYEMLMTFLTDNQSRLIKAIAMEDVVSQPQSIDFLQKYHLPNASSVKKALDTMADKDLVYKTAKGYIVYDRFFDLWLKRTFVGM